MQIRFLGAVILIMLLSACSQNIVNTPTQLFGTTETPLHILTSTMAESPLPDTATPISTSTETVTPFVTPTLPSSATPTINWDEKTVPEKYRYLIGLRYPPLPDGFSTGTGWMVGFGWGIKFFNQNDEVILWLGKFTHYTPANDRLEAHWELVDILLLPPLANEDEYFIPNQCMFNGVPDDEIFVFASLDIENYDRYAENASIRLAWRANRSKGAFEIIPTTGIECVADNAMDIIR